MFILTIKFIINVLYTKFQKHFVITLLENKNLTYQL